MQQHIASHLRKLRLWSSSDQAYRPVSGSTLTADGADEEAGHSLLRGASPEAAEASAGGAPVKKQPLWVWPLLLAALTAVSSAATAFEEMHDVPAITLASWRLQLTSVFLFIPFLFQLRAMTSEVRLKVLHSGWLLFASGSCLAVHFGLWVWGLEHTSLAHSLLLVCCTPVILAAWALIMRHPISKGEIGGTFLALAGGGVLALGASSGSDRESHLSGDAASLAAAVCVVGYFLIGASLRKWMSVFVYAFPVTLIAAILLTSAAAAIDGPAMLFTYLSSKRYFPWVLYLAAGPGLVGHTGLNTLLAHLTTLTIGLAISLEPLVGSLIGWAAGVAGPPNAHTMVGGGMVLAATIIVTYASGRREAAAAAALAAAQGDNVPLLKAQAMSDAAMSSEMPTKRSDSRTDARTDSWNQAHLPQRVTSEGDVMMVCSPSCAHIPVQPDSPPLAASPAAARADLDLDGESFDELATRERRV